jgi:hypothetical protein
MNKPIKFPKTFRVTEETLDILDHTASQAGYNSHTELVEAAIFHFCAYLNHIAKGESDVSV